MTAFREMACVEIRCSAMYEAGADSTACMAAQRLADEACNQWGHDWYPRNLELNRDFLCSRCGAEKP